MAVYAIARRTTNVTSGQSAHTIYTGATNRVMLMEAGIFLAAATSSTYSLGRPAAAGVTPTSPVVLEAEDPASPVSTVNSALAWGTSPTNPTNDLRRWRSRATIGQGVIFTFPKGLLIPVSSNFVLQNLATNGVVDSYFVIDEWQNWSGRVGGVADNRFRNSALWVTTNSVGIQYRSAWPAHAGTLAPERDAAEDFRSQHV